MIFKNNDTKLGDSFKKEVINYIERCRLEDGGYFFARVLPSSGTDTRFAVNGLAILGSRPRNPESIVNFFLSRVREKSLDDIVGVFNAVETITTLGRMNTGLKDYAKDKIMVWQNETGGFGAFRDVDVEVASELQDTYQAVKVLKIIGAPFDAEKITGFVFKLQNGDGGYGRNKHSTLASTFFATGIHKMLGSSKMTLIVTRDYLRKREQNWEIHYIEDLYWLVLGLANLGEKTDYPAKIMNFVMECRRTNGGFSRATAMGITTLEYTWYALSILSEVGGF